MNSFFTNKAMSHIRQSDKVFKIILKEICSQNCPKKTGGEVVKGIAKKCLFFIYNILSSKPW